MPRIVIPQLYPNDRNGNLERLLQSENLEDPKKVPVREFCIDSPYEFMESDAGHPDWDAEFALLLLYLYKIYGKRRNSFKVTDFMRRIVVAYYGGEICQEAIGNPGTRNILIRILLTPGTFVTMIGTQ